MTMADPGAGQQGPARGAQGDRAGGNAGPARASPDALWDDWDSPLRVPGAPGLHLDGFDGALDLLLDLAERARIDLSRISVTDMADQFLAAMVRYERHVTLERRADWLILAARLLQLRSRLLLPSIAEADGAAQAEPGLSRLHNRWFVRAAAAWLEARPQLGRDVFTVPRRERDPRVASTMRLMEACLAVLEREEAQAQTALEAVYRPAIPALFRVPDALARMRRQLAGLAEPMPLTGFLPRVPEAVPDRDLAARSAVSSTFIATLELARNAELLIGGDERFETALATALEGRDHGKEQTPEAPLNAA